MKRKIFLIIMLFGIFALIGVCLESQFSICKIVNCKKMDSWLCAIGGIISPILMYYIFVRQEKSISKNHFESIYFEMLKFYREIKPSTSLHEFRNEFLSHFILSCDIEKQSLPLLKTTLKFIFHLHIRDKDFQKYIRFLGRIILYAEKADVPKAKQKEDYLKLLLSQMSDDEILFLKLYVLLEKSDIMLRPFSCILFDMQQDIGNEYFEKLFEFVVKHKDVDTFDISEFEKQIDFGNINYRQASFICIYTHLKENI